MNSAKEFLGRGFSFPPTLDENTGRFTTVSAEDDIRQSIYIILMTKRKERAMMPDFGCNIHNYIFGLPDGATMTLLKNEIVSALTKWEPRIIDVEVVVNLSQRDTGKIIFDIIYTVRATNNPNNLVFPYYLYEGVGIE